MVRLPGWGKQPNRGVSFPQQTIIGGIGLNLKGIKPKDIQMSYDSLNFLIRRSILRNGFKEPTICAKPLIDMNWTICRKKLLI